MTSNKTDPASRLQRVRIVLVETSHSGNIGAAARAMKVMGLTQLFLVAPRVAVDDQAMRRASGAADVLEQARIVETLDAALEGCAFAVAATARSRQLSPEVLDARNAVLRLAEMAKEAERHRRLAGPRRSRGDDEAGRAGHSRFLISAAIGSGRVKWVKCIR